MFHAAASEVAEKGIPRAQWKKSESRRLALGSFGKKAVHHLERSSVPANRDKVADASRIGLPRDSGRVTGPAGFSLFDFDTAGQQPLQRGPEQFTSAAASCCGVDDG